MFTKLHVHNYRAIGPRPVGIELKPITLLVGPNGSGKSCLQEALALTAQSAIEEPSTADLVLKGKRLDLPSVSFEDHRDKYLQIIHGRKADAPLSVGFSIGVDEGGWSGEGLPMEGPEGDHSWKYWPPKEIGYRWTRTGIDWPGTIWEHELTFDGKAVISVRGGERSGSGRSNVNIRRWIIGPSGKEAEWTGRGERVLPLELLGRNLSSLMPGIVSAGFQDVLSGVRKLFITALDKVHFLSTLRGWQLMEETPAGYDVAHVGKYGDETIRLLNTIKTKFDKNYQSVRSWAEKFEMPSIQDGTEKNRLKVDFADAKTGTQLSVADAASGSRQGLILSAQVLLTPPGSTLLIEEPENNLHPAYEKLLPELFAESILSGHQIIASTHSEVLLAALGNAVRNEKFKSRDVVVWHLERSSQGVQAEQIKISKRGALHGWVKSFSKVDKELFNDWTRKLPEEGSQTGGGHKRMERSRARGSKRRKK